MNVDVGSDGHYAGFILRFCAFVIDTIILCAGLFVIQVFFSIPTSSGTLTHLPTMTPIMFGYNIVAVVLVWLYYSLFESGKWQATPGKRLVKIKVTDYSGNRISFARATGRYFSKYLSTIIFCIGYLMIIFTKKKQALHDMIAKTYVIKD